MCIAPSLICACEQQCILLLINQHTCMLAVRVCIYALCIDPHKPPCSQTGEQFIAIKHFCGAVCGAVPP